MRFNSKYIIVFLGLVGLLFFFIATQPGRQATVPAYFLANQDYQSGKFQEALTGFFDALKENPSLIQKEPLVRFKIGYSFYQTGEYRKSLEVLESGQRSLNEIEDYLLYFQILSHFKMGDTLSGYHKIRELREEFRYSPMIFLVDSIQASIFLKYQQADSALKYLKATLTSGRFEKTEIYLNIIEVLEQLNDVDEFRKYSYTFLKRYPFHNEAERVYTELMKSYKGKIVLSDLKKLFDYLFTTRQYLSSKKLVEEQLKFASTIGEQEYFTWLPVEIEYRQGEYNYVLNWCLSYRKKFRVLSILREIDLHIARCYYRIGKIDHSIKAYLQFQKRYPKDSLSPEVLWKVAWLYEGKFDIKKAIRTYKKLVKIYKRSNFTEEAYFRIGLDLFRIKKYSKAISEWQKALKRVRHGLQRDRIKYWIGKSYEIKRDYKKQGEIYINLAKRPIDSFYNLKAFYLTSNGQDVHRKINEALWELNQNNQSYLPNYISRFRRALQVGEILGTRWGDRELLMVNDNFKEWKELFALGELHERMRNYGDAYRRFRSVFKQNFSDSNLPEMVPVFKKLYPFYFLSYVDSSANTFNVPKALIWSVIKKESAFEPQIISYANAYGLMQLLPGTASQIAPNLKLRYHSTMQLFEPNFNIRMGTYYLSSLLRRYQGNYIMALAAYNAGPHRVDRWKKSYPTYDNDLFMENLEFEQTRVYVRTCMKYFWVYRAIMHPGEIPEEIVKYPVKIVDFL